MNKKAKLRAQVKSRWYYTFWGTATIAVVAGQVYVGTGYRAMSGAFHRAMESISVEVAPDVWQDHYFERHPMVIP